MSEIITEHTSDEAEAQEIELIRGLAKAEGYDPNEVLPEAAHELVAEEATTEEVEASLEEEAPKEEPPPETDPNMQDPDYLFKMRRAKRFAEQHNQAHPEKPIPVPQEQPQQQRVQPQQEPAKPQDDIFRDLGEPPKLEDDPAGFVKWMSDKQTQQDAVIKALLHERMAQQQYAQQQQQIALAQQQQTAWVHEIAQSEQEWIAANPDYPQKYEAVKRGLSEVYKEQGISEEKVTALVRSEMNGMARLAFDEGVHPAKMIESLHKRMFSGVTTPQAQPRARNATGQFVAAREAKASGEGVDLSGANVTEQGGLTPATIRQSGANQDQIEDALTKFGTRGTLELLRRAEMGQ